MTIFGIRIMRERVFREYEAHCGRLIEGAEKDIETLKAKYQYAKARAIVAEQFHRKMELRVWPVAKGVDSGVRIEVGVRPDTEIREA